jgi:FkbM family methyltransferase
MRFIKERIQAWLRGHGIELAKYPAPPFDPIPVFHLCIYRLMELRGESLKFIEVGANDGMCGDPLRPFVLNHHWTGILVEPQPDVFKRLKENYVEYSDRLIFENVAIGPSFNSLTLYRAPNAELKPGESMHPSLTVTSTDPAVVSHQTGVPRASLVEVKVPCLTLDDLIEKHQYNQLDVLQVDVEGFELNVLQTLNFSKTRPGVIQFEHGHLKPKQLSATAELLTKYDYMLYYGGRHSDSIAMPRELFTHS